MKTKSFNSIQAEIEKTEKTKKMLEERLSELKKQALHSKAIFRKTISKGHNSYRIYIYDTSVQEGPIHVGSSSPEHIEKVMEILHNLENNKNAMTALLNQYTSGKLS